MSRIRKNKYVIAQIVFYVIGDRRLKICTVSMNKSFPRVCVYCLIEGFAYLDRVSVKKYD